MSGVRHYLHEPSHLISYDRPWTPAHWGLVTTEVALSRSAALRMHAFGTHVASNIAYGFSVSFDDDGAAYISSINAGTPAAAAQEGGTLQVGDGLVCINGHVVMPHSDLSALLPTGAPRVVLKGA